MSINNVRSGASASRPPSIQRSTPLTHAEMKALAEELGRPLNTLEVLQKDPFCADSPARLRDAEWFADLWQRLDIQRGTHLRRIHYLLVSQDPKVPTPSGAPYVNSSDCVSLLERASLDARYLNLVPAEALVDRRNDEPMIYVPDTIETSADASVPELELVQSYAGLSPLELPRLVIHPPEIAQPYHIELWCEKSTMNDVLIPLGTRYGANVVNAAGEFSLTACVDLIKRAQASERPVRILYLSDFDPAGAGMPVSVARKIEFLLRRDDLDLDIQVRPVVLTAEQCERYRLPRTPIKETETRGATFEARYGEGATELDALEALHPGELHSILVQEIERYHDDDLADRIAEVEGDADSDVNTINDAVHGRYADEITDLQAEHQRIAAEIARTVGRLTATHKRKARDLVRRMQRDLKAEAPDIDDYPWPEPNDGDEDDDPLFDSTRDFIDQTDRYKLHQGKPTAATPRKAARPIEKTCPQCGRAFTTTRSDTTACSRRCRDAQAQAQKKG
jgi:hypothetical protein